MDKPAFQMNFNECISNAHAELSKIREQEDTIYRLIKQKYGAESGNIMAFPFHEAGNAMFHVRNIISRLEELEKEKK